MADKNKNIGIKNKIRDFELNQNSIPKALQWKFDEN